MRQEREGNQDNGLAGYEFDVWVVEDQGEVVRVKLAEADAKNFLTGYGSRTAAVVQARAVLSGVYTSQEQKRS